MDRLEHQMFRELNKNLNDINVTLNENLSKLSLIVEKLLELIIDGNKK